MIDEIQVQNLALIREASLAPCKGLTVITGETGTGKTALLSALKLLMGVRASADLVRDGEEALSVSGRFFNCETSADDELVVTRRVTSDGRSRASINGMMASVGELAQVVAPSVDLCGQFEHQQLMRPATHVRMFDAWAGEDVARALSSYEDAFIAANEAAAELSRVQNASETTSAKLDEARFTLRRIDEVDPREGEYDQLSHDLEIAEHAESLAMAAGSAYEALSGDNGALDALNAAAAALEMGGRVDAELSALAQSLREAGYVLEDVSASARDYRDSVEFDPAMLVAQQERFSQMQGLLRAFGPRMEDVFAAREEAAEIVSLVDDSAARLEAAQRAVEEAEAALAQAACELDAARESAAPRFAEEVTSVMARLEMGGAELVCSQQRLERSSWTKAGPSQFEFLYRPGAGMQARPLARIASGGEVSRVMLATKVVLGAQDDVDTLVFDEVDAGVGGAVAVALAEVIADLACTHQVIVVTHLAQVAVRGQAHYVVERVEGEAGVETHLHPVTGIDRDAEIARMLSGSATETSLAHARELLESARS
ncbi:MAG: DNA repair protein RecN [Eggerthellaceae bacterium]|nr:DNA repair protein RecN [Eggerthellaceae bacterium]